MHRGWALMSTWSGHKFLVARVSFLYYTDWLFLWHDPIIWNFATCNIFLVTGVVIAIFS